MESVSPILHVKTIALIAFIVLAVMLVYAFVKRLIGLVIITLCLILLYAGYLVVTGQRLPATKSEAIRQGIEQIQKIKENGGVSLDYLKKSDPGAGKKNR